MFDLIILDLNMPISDGYEACRKINKLYDDHRLFKPIKIISGRDSNSNLNTYDHLIKELKPLIIACSGDDVDNPFIRRALNEAGFDEAITTPLTVGYVKEKLISMIENNINEVN
jgi:CheY-like chemotaxis protein